MYFFVCRHRGCSAGATAEEQSRFARDGGAGERGSQGARQSRGPAPAAAATEGEGEGEGRAGHGAQAGTGGGGAGCLSEEAAVCQRREEPAYGVLLGCSCEDHTFSSVVEGALVGVS